MCFLPGQLLCLCYGNLQQGKPEHGVGIVGGLQAVRDQIRKMVVGGPLAAEDKNRVDAVSDSEDDEEELTEALKSESSRCSASRAALHRGMVAMPWLLQAW